MAGKKHYSLNTLVQVVLNQVLDKRPRFSLWSKRPLWPIQLSYAGGDADVLIDVYLKLKQSS